MMTLLYILISGCLTDVGISVRRWLVFTHDN
jgi:hypothetical protein